MLTSRNVKLLSILVFSSLVFTQEIAFYRADLGYAMNNLEEEIFINVVELHNKNNKEQ